MTAALETFDPFVVTLAGQQLIEASAGTGKTYTIAGLYLRLVLEGERRVDQILVVTFTNAATAELADRIRKRLLAARRVFAGDPTDDTFLEALRERLGDHARARRRLDNALRGFDEAAVYTIHGFCQRVLADRAFASGMAFETELETDDSERLAEIVDDFWRRHFYQAPPLLVDWLLKQRYTPEKLLAEIRPHLARPYLALRRASASQDLDRLEAEFAAAYRAVRTAWEAGRDEVHDCLAAAMAAGDLKRTSYKAEDLAGWMVEMDDFLAPEQPNLEPCKRLENFTTAKLARMAKQGRTPPEHRFFALCQSLSEARDALAEAFAAKLCDLRADLLDYANRELSARKQRDRVQSYDDLLLNLDQALDGPLADALANAVRKRYSAALIDEFQDTDPLQYAIFRRIYGGSDCPVFLVGDPKQAIYSFRGADIYAYLDAHADARKRLTLGRNWRSVPRLIEAVNTLFEANPQPFLLADIDFHPVRPAAKSDRRELLIDADDADPAPLKLWFLHDPDAKQGKLGKGDAQSQAATACAGEVARLLNLAATGRARLGKEPLRGGDIAVLVFSHAEGETIRQALLRLGVPSVQRSRDNVFDSIEAAELEQLLRAVLEPSRDALVRAALATELVGYDASAILACEGDEARWGSVLDELQEAAERWQRHGFAAMFRELLRRWEVPQRLLGLVAGERRLTDLLHLGELLQTAALTERLAPEPLVAWLAERRRLHGGDVEEQQLRLESDEQLVQIVTVHKSKGLEYPVVFFPFAWSSGRSGNQDAIVRFHDPENENQAVLDFGSGQLDQARTQAAHERLAESLRLLYVALTRAEQRCYLAWGKLNQAESCALAWLLHQPSVRSPDKDAVEAAQDYYKSLDADAVRTRLQRLVETSGGSIALTEPPAGPVAPYRPVQPDPAELSARRFAGPVRGHWQVSSFTGLAAHNAALETTLLQIEQPDHDALTGGEAEPVARQRTIADFPRGAGAGSCLHQIFELLDFTRSDAAGRTALVEHTLARHGFDTGWTALVDAMVERVLAAPLDGAGLRLDQVASQECLKELEFYYPLAPLAGGTMSALLRRYGNWPEALNRHIETLHVNVKAGYMKGFIDLVFKAGGCYYLVDYKSNWLGTSPDDYHPDRLPEAMARESYYLQYLIYAVALHRYLRLRLPDYDYGRHFGGVYYLFLRGIDPTSPGCGIYADRPPPELIEALDQALAGTPSPAASP